MKHLYLLSLALLTFTSTTAQADYHAGYEEAVRYCIRVTETTDLEASCLEAVRSRGPYFSSAVLNLCTGGSWGFFFRCARIGAGRTNPEAVRACDRAKNWDTTLSCLGVVADKYYVDAEIRNCDSYRDWNATISCFQRSGVRYTEGMRDKR